MSRSKAKGEPTDFTVSVADAITGTDPNATLKIFDGHGVLRASGRNRVETKLPTGLYTARVERFGEIREEVIVHRDETQRSIEPPLRNSAMPMADTMHTHEYISGPASYFSVSSTIDQSHVASDLPRLMIMVRKTGDDAEPLRHRMLDLCLYDDTGAVITDFQTAQTAFNDPAPHIVYSALLKAGNYILAGKHRSRTQMLPISLYAGWDNLVFVPFESRPRLSRSSIKMVEHNRGYDPADHLAAELDAALMGLGSRLDLLDPNIRTAAIYGKFDQPLMGLIGAHSHFMSKNKSDRLEQQMLFNLWSLMPGSADVIALLLMSLERDQGGMPQSLPELENHATNAFGDGIGQLLPLTFPPMLNSALQAIMRATQTLPELVAEESWLESAGNSSFGSDVWAMWDQPMLTEPYNVVVQPIIVAPRVPSTQKLYPAIKRAISNVSAVSTKNIVAQADLNDYIVPSQDVIDAVVGEVDIQVPEFQLKVDPPRMDAVKTVRDLVLTLRETAEYVPVQVQTAPAPPVQARPEIADWLVDMVHDHMSQDSFDAGQLARLYAVSKRVIERASKLPRPSQETF